MKKQISLIITLVLICITSIAFASATYPINIDEANFPNPIFREYVKGFSSNGTTLSLHDVNALETLDVISSGIDSLKGIEHFTNLKWLYASGNPITALDLSNNTNLENISLNAKQTFQHWI